MRWEPYKRFVCLCITGYRTPMWSESGIGLVHRHIEAELAGPNTEVILRPFDADWKVVARRLHFYCTQNCRVACVGHSYGIGWGYRQFEKHWHDLGREVDLLVSCDGVSRFTDIPGLRLLNGITALTPLGKLRLNHARRIISFRQVHDQPSGDRIIRPAKTHFTESLFKHVGHNQLDDLAEFRETAAAAVLDLARLT